MTKRKYGYRIVDRHGKPWYGEPWFSRDWVCEDREPMAEIVTNLNERREMEWDDDLAPFRVIKLFWIGK